MNRLCKSAQETIDWQLVWDCGHSSASLPGLHKHEINFQNRRFRGMTLLEKMLKTDDKKSKSLQSCYVSEKKIAFVCFLSSFGIKISKLRMVGDSSKMAFKLSTTTSELTSIWIPYLKTRQDYTTATYTRFQWKLNRLHKLSFTLIIRVSYLLFSAIREFLAPLNSSENISVHIIIFFQKSQTAQVNSADKLQKIRRAVFLDRTEVVRPL